MRGRKPDFSVQKCGDFSGDFVSFFGPKRRNIPFRGWGSKKHMKKAKFAREEKAKCRQNGGAWVKEADRR